MGAPGNDLLAEIENEHPKLGIYLRRYIVPMIQSRGRAGHVLVTPSDAPGDVKLQPISAVALQPNSTSGTFALAKVTGGGTDGSITIEKGQVSAFTPPT